MPQINFSDVLTQLESGLKQLASTSLSDYIKDIKKDVPNMLDGLKTDLETWATGLANGDLTEKNLEYLINSKKDLIEMGTLEKAGVAAIKLDQFKASAVQLITSTIIGLIKI